MPRPRAVRALMVAIATAVCLTVTTLQPVAAATTQAAGIVSFAEAQVGKPWQFQATGLARYDCSGLVWRSFSEAGLASRIGGRQSARAYFRWFRERGLASKSDPKVGDLIVWGNPVVHIGIYTGQSSLGKHMAVSTLTSGVKRHAVTGLYVNFRAYLHVDLER
jgi:cell wall-associated NlpC family hydrolase